MSGYGLAIVEERPIEAAAEMSTILLAEARFYPHLNDMLLAGARAAIEAAGHKHETLTVPGALELPGAIALAARSGRFCAFVALGVVIRGETYHFEVVSEESARGLMDLTLQGYAIGNGILTVENEAQAIVRADPGAGRQGRRRGRRPRSRCSTCASNTRPEHPSTRTCFGPFP